MGNFSAAAMTTRDSASVPGSIIRVRRRIPKSVSIALGAAIPVEALCGLAGVGQLAWQAALARDLPLLTNLTILVTLVTLLANSSADVIGLMLRGEEA